MDEPGGTQGPIWMDRAAPDEIVLLGAGASVKADVPDAVCMVERLFAELAKSSSVGSDPDPMVKYLTLVRRSLEEQGFRDRVDIELLFTAVDRLASRDWRVLGAFSRGWLAELEALEAQVEYRPKRVPPEGRNLPTQILSLMLDVLKRVAWVSDESAVSYLQPLVRWATGGGSVVATLNYDNCVELAARSVGESANTGLREWSKTGILPPTKKGTWLLKLHGSVNWHEALYGGDWIETAVPEQLRESKIIFGAGNKLSAEGPYLQLLSRFREILAESQVLAVVGYSFRDPHINEIIAEWHRVKVGTACIRIANGPRFSYDDEPFFRRNDTKDVCRTNSGLWAEEAFARWYGAQE